MKTQYKMALSGFTLLELVLVITLISSLLTLSLYHWSAWQQRHQLRQTAVELQAFLTRIREQAHWYNRHYPLWVRQEKEGWCVGAGLPAPGCQSSATPFIWHAPYPQVKFFQRLGEPSFYGERSMAWPGSIEFGYPDQHWRVIISARARIRICKTALKGC